MLAWAICHTLGMSCGGVRRYFHAFRSAVVGRASLARLIPSSYTLPRDAKTNAFAELSKTIASPIRPLRFMCARPAASSCGRAPDAARELAANAPSAQVPQVR